MMKDNKSDNVKVKKETESRNSLAISFLKESFEKGNSIKILSLGIEVRK